MRRFSRLSAELGLSVLIRVNRVALIIQIHLQQNRVDLAAKEAQQARKWAQDSLLVNIAESWVGLREVRCEKGYTVTFLGSADG